MHSHLLKNYETSIFHISYNMNNIFYGLWDSNKQIDSIQLTQIKLWATSIKFFYPNAQINLYTKKNIIPNPIEGANLIYVNNFEQLLQNTPLKNYKIHPNLSKPEMSDIIRIALLYKYGGTWMDVDDVVVRKFPEQKNILGTFLWKNNKTTATYWGSTFNLADGTLISKQYSNFGFHIQNDPMINWEKGNKFLYMWMEKIQKYNSEDWGQKLPTNIIKYNPHVIKEFQITLLPQHHLLLHPAFGSCEQFGYPNSKGPMFPPYDLRIIGKVNYDDLMTEKEFWQMAKQTLKKHSYFCVKNSKNIGIQQANEKKDKRWFIGYLCDINNIQNILHKFNSLNN